jgi:hypothetical protein
MTNLSEEQVLEKSFELIFTFDEVSLTKLHVEPGITCC